MKKENNKFIFVVADINRHVLCVPRYVMEKVYDLKSPEAGLVNEYLAKYPGFKIEVVESIYLRGIGLLSSSMFAC